MKRLKEDRKSCRNIEPVTYYPVQTLPKTDLDLYKKIRSDGNFKFLNMLVPSYDACCFYAPEDGFFRISSVEGTQVGGLNLWSNPNLSERFYSGKTQALHGSHIKLG